MPSKRKASAKNKTSASLNVTAKDVTTKDVTTKDVTTNDVINKENDNKKLSSSSEFPIVAIGASAGGLEAFTLFFKNCPDKPNMAFVLIAHLDPKHHSLLPELIQRTTKLEVRHLNDNIKIEANNIYIIPPNKELAILNGHLQLLELTQPHGLNRPIDSFFSSLSQDQGDKAVAIILSGSGSDGSQGILAIKKQGGLVIVQDEQSAKHSGMPHSAIDTGLVDYILPVEKMPEQLLHYKSKEHIHSLALVDKNILNALDKIFVILRAKTNHDFSQYKKNTICRRIERRMNVQQISQIDAYVKLLQINEEEVRTLFNDLLIGVTSFFRDKEAFNLLMKEYLPALLKDKPDNYQIRVWIPGCSSGEEAYSIAIAIYECMEKLKKYFSIQLFGTDIDERAIDKARRGLYPESIAADVSEIFLKKYFIKEGKQYQIRKMIRELVVFAPQNITNDPPFTKLDLLCCRNLLIYFGAELQKKLLPIFHYSLKEKGLLFLGSSETIGQATDLFSFIDKKWKIFQRSGSHKIPHQVLTITPEAPYESQNNAKPNQDMMKPNNSLDTVKLLKTILAHSDLSARVVIDKNANIIYVHGRTGYFLEPAEGIISNNIIEMARSGLDSGLSNAIRQVNTSGTEVEIKHLKVKNNGDYLDVNLTIKPLPKIQVGQAGLMMIVFEENEALTQKKVKTISSDKKTLKNVEIESLEKELQHTKENLQSTIEELETSNEEMKSTNEELQSTNEELQSSNEELETSKEELQSLNEESSTVNTELQSRIDDLMNAKDDIKNLLDATEIASIFLDINLGIRRFTPMATKIFPLTTADIGRPIKHFTSTLMIKDIENHAQLVLNDLSMKEMEVDDTTDRTYRMRIRPYRTTNNVIDGVVITFEDITEIKKYQTELSMLASGYEEKLFMMSKVFMDGAEPIIIEDLKGNIIEVNEATIHCYGWSRTELLATKSQILIPEQYKKEVQKLIQSCIKKNKVLSDIDGFRLNKSGQSIPTRITLLPIKDSNGDVCAISTIMKIQH